MSVFSRQASIRRPKNSATKLFTETGIKLGKGAYGEIFEVDYLGTLCAAKKIHPILVQAANENEFRRLKNSLITECRIWQSLRNPNIVQILKVCYDPVMGRSVLPIIIMEKMLLSLTSLAEKYNNIPLNVKASILHDVSLGLRYLHSQNPPIVHRDLTPGNVLLTCYLVAKISDMGVAKILQRDVKTMTEGPGTADFMPPESLTKRPSYGLSLDVFSFGAVALFTITQQWPTPGSWVVIDSKRNSVYLSEVQRRQDYIQKMTGGAADLQPLVVKCLDNDPIKRPTIVEVSTTIKKCKLATEERMGKPIKWWVDVSSEQQAGQAEQQLKETTSLETQTTKILQLESELLCAKEFITAKKAVKAYRKFSEKRKPEQGRENQQRQPERCSTTHGSSRGHFLRCLSFNNRKHHRQSVHQAQKTLLRSGSFPLIDKLV